MNIWNHMNLSQETGAPVSVDEFMATKHLVLTEKNRGGIGLKEKIGDGGCSEGTGVFEGTEDRSVRLAVL